MDKERQLSGLDARIRMLENALRKLEQGRVGNIGELREDYRRRLRTLKQQRDRLATESN